jgi:hypothetical protein
MSGPFCFSKIEDRMKAAIRTVNISHVDDRIGERFYCAPLSALAQKANGYLNWISASRLTWTLISPVRTRPW